MIEKNIERIALERARDNLRECDLEILSLRRTLVDVINIIAGRRPDKDITDILELCLEAINRPGRSIGRESL